MIENYKLPAEFNNTFNISTIGELRNKFDDLAGQKVSKKFYTMMSKWSRTLKDRSPEKLAITGMLLDYLKKTRADDESSLFYKNKA